jgi:DNA uptake protein ComE-like DNA-binding protein
VNAIKKRLKSFFLLSGSQANGLMVLLPLLFILIVSEPAWRWWKVRHWKPDPRDSARLDSLVAAWKKSSLAADSVAVVAPESRFFAFDPNLASVSDLVRLGFNERLARRIENYRKKGGKFKARADLLKIYGMDSAHYQKLATYIKIAVNTKQEPDTHSDPTNKFRKSFAERSGAGRAREQPFDLNLADTARLEAVRGIGEKLSRRIIKYRSSLGGFVRVEQVSEVFGLDSITVAKLMETAFVSPDFLPDRIDLNTASEEVLERHAYLNRQEARAIVAWRFQHGRFSSVADLRKLPIFSDEKKIRRLEPYLKTVE